MKRIFLKTITAAVIALISSLLVYGQGSNSSLSGVVTDQNGAVIAGASITVKNPATGEEFKAVTASNGTYSVPVLAAGTYTVTISAQGFKTTVVNDVKLEAGVPGTVNGDLQVGSASESVVVQGGGEVLQTQSANVSTTLSTTQISQLPLQSRNTIYFLTLLPGVSSSATASPRNSTINGLPSSAYNITIDGLNTQDNTNKNTDGFFSYISPSLDAIQEVTLSTATPGAESAGQGAVQIKFVTRQGTNDYHGSGYYYYRNTGFNSNYWFANRDTAPVNDATGLRCVDGVTTAVVAGVNELYNPDKCKAPRAKALFHQAGFRVGGPISIPKLFNGKDRAFFFVNFEEFRQPNAVIRTRTILNPTTQAGTFQYVVNGVTQTKNLLTLAAANGQTATIDPVIGKLLSDIRSSTASTGGIVQLSNPNIQSFTFSNGSMGLRYLPTTRFDFNLTSKHHLESTYNYQSYNTTIDTLNSVDPAFPGFPNHGSQVSNRFAFGATLRSTLKPTLVNEARFGFNGGTVLFFGEINPGQFANQGGFSLGIGTASFGGTAITSATVSRAPSRRNAPFKDFADTVTWTRGAHSFSFGGQFSQTNLWLQNQTVVPSITFGFASGDPAAAMFTTANFPGASGTNLTEAQNLYAVLTGRVTAINATASLDETTSKYAYLGRAIQRTEQRELGFFGQDSWRARPNLTLTGGVRWEPVFPFKARNNTYASPTLAGLLGVSGAGNLFKPGTLTGSPTLFYQVKDGDKFYNTDWNNIAPSVGFAWSPAVKNGWLKRIIGDGGQTVIRGGYSIAYNRQGLGSVTSALGANPGINIDATRSTNLGNLVTGTGTDVLPVLLSQTSRLGAPAFTAAPTYPFQGALTDQANIFDPKIKTPYTQSWTLGIQREINKDMAVEVRYVHTVNLQQWLFYNFNEVNIVENGFLAEFKKAQANLQANIAAGRGNTFAYTGASGTSPLPIYLAYFSGIPASQASDTTKYTSSNFTNASFVNPLALQNPNPYTPASASSSAGLYGSATFRTNAANAGLASNFFLANPGLQGGSFSESNGGYSRYDGLQIDLRRRMSKGLLMDANYTFAKGYVGNSYSFRQGWVNQLSTNNGGTIKHAFKLNWIYDLPIGKGKMLLGNVGGLLDRLVGGWEWQGTGRVQTGANLNLGNIRLVGMSQKDVQAAYKLRFNDANRIVYIFPQDIIDNTIRAFSTSATSATGYSGTAPTGRYFAPANSPTCIQVVTGDCAGQTVFIQGPLFTRFDLSMIKRIKFNERVNFELRVELLNAFNNINFLGNTNITPSSSQTFGQVTSAYRDVNNTQDPGGRLGQLVLRINF